MSTFLDDAGVITWFNQPVLKELIVLNPHWLASLMSSLVSFTVNWRNGNIKGDDLQLAWKHIPTTLHSTLVQLLEKFEIIYNIGTK